MKRIQVSLSRVGIILLFSGLIIGIASCSGGKEVRDAVTESNVLPAVPTDSTVSTPAPTPSDLDGLSAVEALAKANAWGRSEKRVASHVDAQNVVFAFTDGETVSIPLPEDRMVVAVAPYFEKTHPCATHAMSGCLGELTDVPVRVRAALADGTVLFDEVMQTLPNGFVELWLPRDREVTLRLETLGRSAEGIITTFDTSDTCVTTLRLV